MSTRRKFLTGISASALLVATHGRIAWAAGGPPSGPPRILSLRLATSAPLEEMRRFYQEKLGLPVVENGADELTIAAGVSTITFFRAEREHGAPFYHFAFNIPENKLLAARDWQLERTPLIPARNLRDPDFPDDVVHFRSWNAHSVFFWDPAGNLVEHIARHDLDNAAPGPFTPDDLLYVSEIAFIVDDVPAMASRLWKTFELDAYRPGNDRFTAVGDEHGLLLVMKRGRNLGFDEGKPADVFPTSADIRAAKPARLVVPDFPYEITTA